jgi:hypothetical protein
MDATYEAEKSIERDFWERQADSRDEKFIQDSD